MCLWKGLCSDSKINFWLARGRVYNAHDTVTPRTQCENVKDRVCLFSMLSVRPLAAGFWLPFESFYDHLIVMNTLEEEI